MKNIDLYFLRSFEKDIARELLPYATFLTPADELSHLVHYTEHYGLYRSDIGVYALVDGKIAAAAWARLLKASQNGFAYVDDETPELVLAVKPEYRGIGVAKQLMQQLLSEVSRSFKQISLSVLKEDPALKFYESLGFRALEGSKHPQRESLILLKNLEDAPNQTQEEDWFKATQKWRNDIY